MPGSREREIKGRIRVRVKEIGKNRVQVFSHTHIFY